MTTRHIGKLTAVKVAREKRPGLYGDGAGLYLQVTSGSAKSWIFRYGGKYLGLGSAFTTTLQEARELAHECRRLRGQGIDPIQAKRSRKVEARLEAAKTITFGQCASAYIDAHKAEWKSARHLAQWQNTTRQYCGVINDLPVQQVDTPLVLNVLQPIWNTRTVTASRLRGRIESILDHAKVSTYRDGDNPARWRGHLEHMLADLLKATDRKNHPAMPYAEIPQFVAKLRQDGGVAAKALEFIVLTAARSGEALGATWSEFDLKEGTWTIPAQRMKAGREHRVPLSPAVMSILSAMKAQKTGDGLVFGVSPKVISRLMRKTDATVHGFRSSFRDWAAEETHVANEVCEAALAHTISSKVEAAYRRGDLFEKRRALMEAWSRYCDGVGKAGVVPLRRTTTN